MSLSTRWSAGRDWFSTCLWWTWCRAGRGLWIAFQFPLIVTEKLVLWLLSGVGIGLMAIGVETLVRRPAPPPRSFSEMLDASDGWSWLPDLGFLFGLFLGTMCGILWMKSLSVTDPEIFRRIYYGKMTEVGTQASGRRTMMAHQRVQTTGTVKMVGDIQTMRSVSTNTSGGYPAGLTNMPDRFVDRDFCLQLPLRIEDQRQEIIDWMSRLRPTRSHLTDERTLSKLETMTQSVRPEGIRCQPFLTQMIYLFTDLGMTTGTRCEAEDRWESGQCWECGRRQRNPQGLNFAGSCAGGCWFPDPPPGAEAAVAQLIGRLSGSVGGTG